MQIRLTEGFVTAEVSYKFSPKKFVLKIFYFEVASIRSNFRSLTSNTSPGSKMVAQPGFEPGKSAPKADVLPLHYRAIRMSYIVDRMSYPRYTKCDRLPTIIKGLYPSRLFHRYFFLPQMVYFLQLQLLQLV